MTNKPKHYQKVYRRPITEAERKSGMIEVKLDPYRISDALNLGGGAREQIMKKALRWTDKGDDIVKVVNEIKQACDRQLEMLEEDGHFTSPAPPVDPSTPTLDSLVYATPFTPSKPVPAVESPWIEWTGLIGIGHDSVGTPLPDYTDKVEVEYRNGACITNIAGSFDWQHSASGTNPGDDDIIKFRYIK